MIEPDCLYKLKNNMVIYVYQILNTEKFINGGIFDPGDYWVLFKINPGEYIVATDKHIVIKDIGKLNRYYNKLNVYIHVKTGKIFVFKLNTEKEFNKHFEKIA